MDKVEKQSWKALVVCAVICTTCLTVLTGTLVKDTLSPLPSVELTPTSLEDEGIQIIDAKFCRRKPQPVQNVQPPVVVIGTQSSNSTTVQLNNIISQFNQNESRLQAQIDNLVQQLAGIHSGADGKDGKDGLNGKDGKDGIDGKSIPGPAGPPGVSPSIESIIAKIDMSKLKGQDGKDGINGKDGVVDPQSVQVAVNNYINQNQSSLKGKDGKDGKDGVVDWTKVDLNPLVDKLPPFWVKVIDPNGVYTTKAAPVRLGEQMNLILSPANSTGVSGGVGVQVEGAKTGGT